MPPLKNPKHEKIAVNLFNGMTATAALLDAGYKPGCATRSTAIIKYAKIDLRVRELQEELALTYSSNPKIATVKERKERLSEILRANLPDFVTPDGIKVEKTSPNVGAVSELTTRQRAYHKGQEPVVITQIKLRDPVGAISELNKMERIGTESDRGTTQVLNSFVFVLPDGTQRTAREMLNPVKELKEGVNGQDGSGTDEALP